MTRPRTAELLAAAIAALKADVAVATIVGERVYNHIPQDQREFPYLYVRLSRIGEWDTKSSDGLDCDILVDSVVNQDGDKTALELGSAANDALHNNPLTLASGHQVVLQRYVTGDSPEPADTLSHRNSLIFHVLAG